MQHDALAAHARDELGLTEVAAARPVQAAAASALSFSLGAIFPILAVLLAPAAALLPVLYILTLLLLAILGGVAAWAGGASVWRGAIRVLIWGALSLGATTLIGHLLGTAVA